MNYREDGIKSTGNHNPISVDDKTRSMPVPVPRTRPVARPRNQGKSASLAPDIQITDMSSTLPGQKPSLPPKPRREPPEPPMGCNNVPKKTSREEKKPVNISKPGTEKILQDSNCVSNNNNNNSESLQNGAVARNSDALVKAAESGIPAEVVSSDSDEDFSVPGRKTSEPNKLEPSGGNKPKPSPPKKPLPQLPKQPQDCQSAKKDSLPGTKPPIPSKPPPMKYSPPKVEAVPQPSVAALASKLAAVPVFPLKPPENGKIGSGPPTSPRLSPRPSPATSPRPSPKGSPSITPKVGHSTRLNANVQSKENGLSNKPSSVRPIPSSKPVKLDAKDFVSRKPPNRPSPPSADVLARRRSRTAENLGDDATQVTSNTKPVEPNDPGPLRKSSNPETGKKRLAQRARSLAPALNALKPSSREVSQRRSPPPLPLGAEGSQLNRKSSQNRPPPIPECPRPRPSSAIVQSSIRESLKNSKSTSVGDISRAVAEDDAEYTYAYQHTVMTRSKSQQNVPTAQETSSDNEYTVPEATAVAGFVESINKKPAVEEESGLYEDVDDVDSTPLAKETPEEFDSEDSFTDGSDDLHEYEDADPPASGESSDSDDSHDYELPPEEDSFSRPHGPSTGSADYFEPIHKSASDSGSSENEQDEVMEDEPLYQVYVSRTLRRERNMSRTTSSSSNTSADMSLDELTQGTLRNMRMLWCELPEVKACGILETMKSDERKRQEAMFEVITSEASYLKSLNILVSHFMKSADFSPASPQCVLERGQYHVLFSNVGAIKDVSERFLQCLRERQKEALVISTISDIIEEHASRYFEVYVKYCSNQIYQDRTIKALRMKSPRFVEVLNKLESMRDAQGLTLQSFLVLPMQRITRLPLLVDAICHRCEPGSKEFLATDKALSAVNKTVYNCNEGARKMERMEEMFRLQVQIEFKTKPIALATSSRYLLRMGELSLAQEDNRATLKKGRHMKFKPIYLFLFNDLVLLTKKKSDNRFQVLDHATRNMSQLGEGSESDLSTKLEHAFSLILLENSEGKTKDFVLVCESETDRTRWMEAFKPSLGATDGETVYESWDCPQVQAVHKYVAQQPDELSLHKGDVINVLRKLPDGWYHGERLCDAVQGWFPANHTEEIRNEHVRARNLLQRYRLLAASKHLIGMTLKR